VVINNYMTQSRGGESSSEDDVSSYQFDVHPLAQKPRGVGLEFLFNDRCCDDRCDIECSHRGSEQLVHEGDNGTSRLKDLSTLYNKSRAGFESDHGAKKGKLFHVGEFLSSEGRNPSAKQRKPSTSDGKAGQKIDWMGMCRVK
jgi:hypothetical protein